jgi:hypothetical protein
MRAVPLGTAVATTSQAITINFLSTFNTNKTSTDRALHAAQEIYQENFNRIPYTTFPLLQFLLQSGKKSYKQALYDKDLIKHELQAHDGKINKAYAEVAGLYSGRCTSFATMVATLLMKRANFYPWKFEFYDLAGHPVAICKKSLVVTDSSSDHVGGAVVLKNGDWKSFADGTRKWKYEYVAGKSRIVDRSGKEVG